MERGEILGSKQSSSRRISPFIYLTGMILLGLLLTFVIINQTGQSATNILPSTSSADKVFSSEQDGYSVRTPIGWNTLSEEELGKFKGSFAFAVEHKEPLAFFGVKVQTAKTNSADLEQIALRLDKATAEQFESVENQQRDIVKLNGRDALRYEFTFVSESDKMREQIVLISARSKVYHLSASALDRDYDSVRADFDKLIEGFIISD